MGLLEYANRVVPDQVKKSIPGFYDSDPLFESLRKKNKVKRSGGSQVRFLRIISGHSDASEIDGTNISVDLTKRDTTSVMTGDWAKYIKPVILPHVDADRMQSAEDKARLVRDTTDAAMMSMLLDVKQRAYIGDRTGKAGFLGLGTLHGSRTNGTKSGFENGAIRFESPTAQAAAAIAYLNETRVEDTAAFMNNWYNQYAQHGGIGVDALENIEVVKATADSFSEDSEGISIGIAGITEMTGLSAEIRSYPGGGGQSAVIYNAADLAAGKVFKQVTMAAGIRFYANRWMTAARMGVTGAIYLLNPSGIEWWVNANNDFRVTKFRDFLETTGQDADVGFIVLEAQLAAPNLLIQGAVGA